MKFKSSLLMFGIAILLVALPGNSEADQKITNHRGQVVGSVRACVNGLCFRDQAGRNVGRAVVRGNRVIVYDHRGIRR